MVIERYRVTLTHDIIENGNVIKCEEPKCYEVHNTDLDNDYVFGNKNMILDELFYRFLRELKGY